MSKELFTADLSGLGTGPEDGRKNMEIMRRAARDCCSRGSGRITLPTGTYRLNNAEGDLFFRQLMQGELNPRGGQFQSNPCLAFEGCRDLVIDGQGSTLLFNGLIQPFSFTGCRNVVLKNIVVDWERPAFSVGRAVSVQGDVLEIDVFPEYPIAGGMSIVSFQDYNQYLGRLGGACPFFGIDILETPQSQKVRIRHEHCSYVKPGTLVVLRHLYGFAPAITIKSTAGARIEDVTLLANPGPGVIGADSSDITFRNLQVRPRDGRVMSTNVDATHFVGCWGTIDFEDCYFEGMGDDACNVHGRYHFVREKLDDRTLLLDFGYQGQGKGGLEAIEPGDMVEFVRRASLYSYASNRVTAIEAQEDELFRLSFAEALPEGLRDDDLVTNVSRTACVRFVGNTVRNIRGRAFLIQSRGVLVEDCLFDHCTGQGLHIDTAGGWWESIGTRDVVIRNNEFVGCGYGRQTYCDASGLVIETECPEPVVGVHRNIVIENNIIQGRNDLDPRLERQAIIITCADGVLVRENTIENCRPAIRVAYSENVDILDNDTGAGGVTVGGEINHKGIMVLPD